MKLLDDIRKWVDADKSVKRVAEDLQLTSELILLVQIMFVDGEIRKREMADFKRICNVAFGIPEDDVPQVVQYLKDFGYETSVQDAANMFEEMPFERKKELLLNMLSIAKSDESLHASEVELIRKTAEILGIDAQSLSQITA